MSLRRRRRDGDALSIEQHNAARRLLAARMLNVSGRVAVAGLSRRDSRTRYGASSSASGGSFDATDEPGRSSVPDWKTQRFNPL